MPPTCPRTGDGPRTGGPGFPGTGGEHKLRMHSASSLLALGLLLGSCSRAETRDGREAGFGRLPPTLEAAEGLAEDIQTDIDTLGWAAAEVKVAKLRQQEAGVG